MSNSTLYNRVRETTTVTGTGTATLLGAASGYQSFAAVGNGNTTFYVIADQNGGPNWEVGVGTYTLSGTTLSRTTVLASSNSGSLVNFTAGTKDVFIDAPASILNNYASFNQANTFTSQQIFNAGVTATEIAAPFAATDVAPTNLVIVGSNAYAHAVTNPAGGNVTVVPGTGRQFLGVSNFASISGSATVTVTVNGIATVLTNGVNWSNATSNAATATSISTAINASAAAVGVTATVFSSTEVLVQFNTGYYGTLATSDATNLPVSSGAAGAFVVQNPDGNTAHQAQIWHDGTNIQVRNPANTSTFGGITFGSAGGNMYPLVNGSISTTAGYYTAGSYNMTAFGGSIQVAGYAGITFQNGYMTTVGFLQNSGGCKVLNANATNATNVLAASNLTVTLIAGRSYPIKMKISGGNSTATEGFQFALVADGTLTATTFDLEVVGVIGTEVTGTQRVTALGTPITFTTFTQPTDVYLVGSIKCGVGGVGTIQFAEQSTHVSGTATLNAGSWISFEDGVAV